MLDLKIFIGTPCQPANGKWYDLTQEEEKETALAKCNELDEYLISDIESNFKLKSELSIDEYIKFLDFVNDLDEYEQEKLEAACFYDSYYINNYDNISIDDIDLYYVNSFEELAKQFADEWLLGKIPKHLENYIDYKSIGNDLSYDYNESEVNGNTCFIRIN